MKVEFLVKTSFGNGLIPGTTTRMRSNVVVVPARRSTTTTPATTLTRFVAVLIVINTFALAC
jgi:hypothetical protein